MQVGWRLAEKLLVRGWTMEGTLHRRRSQITSLAQKSACGISEASYGVSIIIRVEHVYLSLDHVGY